MVTWLARSLGDLLAQRGALRRTVQGKGRVLRGVTRTHKSDRGGLERILWESGGSPFKTAAFNRSATTPGGYNVFRLNRLFK
jgi:hypothetical protein